MALAILSSMEEDIFRQSIENEDVGALSDLPGIGVKTAQRLIVEMKDRFKDEFWQGAAITSADSRSDHSQGCIGGFSGPRATSPAKQKSLIKKSEH